MGGNSEEAIFFVPDILLDPSKLFEIDAAWEDLYGPRYLRGRQSIEEVTDEDRELSAKVREYFFAPDGIIELDKLDRFVEMYSDSALK